MLRRRTALSLHHPRSPRDLQRCLKVRQVRHRAPPRYTKCASRRTLTHHRSHISQILDFSRRVTIVIKRPCCELVHQEWLTTARSHTVASCDERGLACAAHTDVVYIHICGHVSAGSGHGFRIFPWPNNRCCSGANGRLPSRHWHPSQQ